MNNKYYCFYDMETTSKDPNICEPVQLSAVIINPRTLEKVEGGEFNSVICPPSFHNNDFEEKHEEVIQFHCKAQKCTKVELMDRWKNAPSEQLVWNNFNSFIKKYHASDRPSKYSAPISCGFNILNYDDIIIERLMAKYNNPYLFSSLHKIDLMNVVMLWTEDNPDVEKLSFDYLREYFGMSTKGAHDSLVDVHQGADLLIRFLKLTRRTASRTKFKGAFANGIL